MMKRYFMIFSAALTALVSCHKEFVQDSAREPQMESHEVTIEAGILSKTVLDGNAVMWEGADEIALVFTHASSSPHVNKTFVNQEAEQTTARALFKGQFPDDVSLDDGYNDLGYAVYPKTALTDDGEFRHNLSAVQVAKANGSFPSGCNLSSTALALSEMGEGGSTKTDFRNALSVLRIALSTDVKSVTITGTAPLAGTAPLVMYYNSADDKDVDNGRLLVDAGGLWSDASNSVTLTPADGVAFEDKTYNVLVWPGEQEGLAITLDFKNLGEYEKTSSISTSKPVTFKPAKFYNLNVKNTEELVVTEITGRLDELEDNIPSQDELESLEGEVDELVKQIQSISLMSEYLGNTVYARYAQMTYSKQKVDLTLDYIIKPDAAAEALVEAFNQNPAVVSALCGYDKGAGVEMPSSPLAVKGMSVSELPGIGKVVTATVDASDIDNKFYDGDWGASVALQVVSGKTDIMSDFANLVPKAGSVITGSYLKDIPAVPGARVVIPFSYAVSDWNAPYTLKVSGTNNVSNAYVNFDADSRTGNLTVAFNENISSPSVTLELNVADGQEVLTNEFTFIDNGSRIELNHNGAVDYIGGEVVVTATTQNLGSGQLLLTSGSGVTQSINVFTFEENSSGERTANVEFSVASNSLWYYKDVTLVQKAYGTSLGRTYYSNGQNVVLNQANAGCLNYFNIVILGDGYKKKDLAVGGKFERSARSAMDSFFAIEPYKTFMNRFNVYMASYESAEEGTDVRSAGITKDTYFNTYCQGGGNTASYVSDATPVINAVKAVVGNGDAQYYRTIAIVLVNTDEQAGSTGYPFRDYKSGFVNGYASFAIAVLAANSTGTNGLVKHEAGGHAFGRLADEYFNSGSTASSSNKADLSNWHAKGWYWNVNPSNTGDYYMFTNSAYSSSEVSFIEGGWGYGYGMYRSTQGGMMQGNTGVFNAPSRHAIYHRIITESEGSSAYSWSRFLEYDQINR